MSDPLRVPVAHVNCLLLMAIYFSVGGCECSPRAKESGIMASAAKSPIMSAEVHWEMDAHSNRIDRTLLISDRDQLRQLLAFFPGVGEGKQSNRFGMWKRGALIRFTREDGSTLAVSVNPKLTRWTEGGGDWPAEPGLGEFLQRCFGDFQ